MNLTGRQIKDQGIITGPIKEENIQPVGIDLNVIGIREIIKGAHIPKEGKTILPREYRSPEQKKEDGKYSWILTPGVYEITFAQGCKIPPNHRLRIVQRSSLLRAGGMIASSMFDPGFFSNQMGSCMTITAPLTIEIGARIAQAYTDTTNEVSEDDLYKGQWQGDKQREEQK